MNIISRPLTFKKTYLQKLINDKRIIHAFLKYRADQINHYRHISQSEFIDFVSDFMGKLGCKVQKHEWCPISFYDSNNHKCRRFIERLVENKGRELLLSIFGQNYKDVFHPFDLDMLVYIYRHHFSELDVIASTIPYVIDRRDVDKTVDSSNNVHVGASDYVKHTDIVPDFSSMLYQEHISGKKSYRYQCITFPPPSDITLEDFNRDISINHILGLLYLYGQEKFFKEAPSDIKERVKTVLAHHYYLSRYNSWVKNEMLKLNINPDIFRFISVNNNTGKEETQ